jgi:hypothetical protein
MLLHADYFLKASLKFTTPLSRQPLFPFLSSRSSLHHPLPAVSPARTAVAAVVRVALECSRVDEGGGGGHAGGLVEGGVLWCVSHAVASDADVVASDADAVASDAAAFNVSHRELLVLL